MIRRNSRQLTRLAWTGVFNVSLLALVPALAGADVSDDRRSCREALDRRHQATQSDNRRRVQECVPRRAISVLDREATPPNAESGESAGSESPFRITVNGTVVDEAGASDPAASGSGADAQRRADLQLAEAGAQFTFDALNAKPILNVIADHVSARPADRVRFHTFWNYPDFTTRAEIRIFAPDANLTGAPSRVLSGEEPIWTVDGQPGEQWRYVLRVYDAGGGFDETAARTLAVVAPGTEVEPTVPDILADDTTVIRNIKARGGTATLKVENLPPGATVNAFGAPVTVDAAGVAFAQRILPRGVHSIGVVIDRPGREPIQVERSFEIPAEPGFSLFFADLTVGYRGGDLRYAATPGPDSDPERDFVEGRLAFYLDRQLESGVRVVASADTEEREIDELFLNFDRRDARSIVRRLDPDRTWPLFGDDSTTIDNAPTSGRFYVRAEQDQSYVQWGDFQTRLTGSELTSFSRSLYGGQASIRGDRSTRFGEAAQRLEAFLAQPGTTPARDEFRATGGSVFFLRRQDVNEGSERLFVEVRDRDSGLVSARRELSPGTDYDMNYLQGRIFLREPIETTRASTDLVQTGAPGGDPVYLVVAYEYSPGFEQSEAYTVGGRGQWWVNDFIGFGATAYRQGEEDDRQTLLGADVTLRYRPSTYLKAELGQSTGAGTAALLSGTGGYDFATQTLDGQQAGAYRIESGFDLADFVDSGRGRIQAYIQERERGYSAPGQAAPDEQLRQAGMTASIALTDRTTVTGKVDLRDGTSSETLVGEVSALHGLDNGWSVGIGARADDRQGTAVASASPSLNQLGGRTDLVVSLSYSPLKPSEEAEGAGEWSLRGFAQKTLDADGARPDNSRIGLGGSLRITERATASIEVSDGDLGPGGRANLGYDYSDRGTVYLGYQLAAENPDSFDAGRLGRLTTGMRTRFNDNVGMFVEGRYVHGAGPTGLTQSYGIDLRPVKSWLATLSYETGALSDASSGDIDRNAVSGTLSYRTDTTGWSGTLEWREDQSIQSGDRTVFAWRSLLSVQATPDTRLYAKVSGANTEETRNAAGEADFFEGTLAAAFRPVDHDRWNTLFKYTYLADLPSPAQVDANARGIDFAQRGQVISIDSNWAATGWLTVGGRYAFKIAELRPSRDRSAQWFDSTLHYFAGRADIAFTKEWDFMVEGRLLETEESGSSRYGAVMTLHRHLNDQVRLGLGYNFARFSDDLFDTSGRSMGAFINLTGAW